MAVWEGALGRLPPEMADIAAEILDRIQDGFYAIDESWRLVYANRRACEMWGAAPETIIGRVLWERFPQIVGTAAGQQLRDAVEGGGAREFETLSPVVGRWLWLRVDPIGRGMTGVSWRDITARKRTEQALWASEERLRIASETARLGHWERDLVTGALWSSDNCKANYGLPPHAELPYDRVLAAIHPDYRERVREASRRAVQERTTYEVEYPITWPDGSVHWISVRGRCLYGEDGTPARNVGVTLDITDRKRLDEEMRQLTERLEARVEARTRELAELNDRLRRERLMSELIIENSAEGIIVVDTELRILVWNPAMESINGLPRAEVLGKTLFEAFPHLADNAVGQMWRDAVAGRRAALRDRQWFAPARGEQIVYDADYTPLYDQRRSIIGAISIVRETTERRRMEDMLRQSQKMEAVAQLTGGVAHDFNNLLTSVIGCLELISLESEDERMASLAQTALRSANRGSRLTQQLLSFARRQALRSVAADLNALLADMEMLLRRAAGGAIEVIVDKAAGLWGCEVDPAQFEAAAMNLVMNARDAMPSGGRLTLGTQNVEAACVPDGVDLAPGDYVAFAVRDAGRGMTAEVATRAFEPFYTTKDVGKGSGLGLSMVYGFAKQSRGGVRIESAPGAGTCVTIYLPRAATSPAAASDAESTPEPPQRGFGHILVVEDDADVREVSVATLLSLGYRVSVACNGVEALDMLRRDDPIDLLFTDLMMPQGLSGIDLARQAQALRPGLKVLLTSGYAGPEAAGIEAFPTLPKPFRPAELSRILAELLGGPHGD